MPSKSIARVRTTAQEQGPHVEVHVKDICALLLALDDSEARYEELRALRLADLERQDQERAG